MLHSQALSHISNLEQEEQNLSRVSSIALNQGTLANGKGSVQLAS
jgi:hypothetical protein